MPGRGEIPKGKDAWPWAFLLIPSQRYRRPRKVKITGKPAVDCYQKSTSLNTADKQEIAKKSPAVSRSSSYGLVLRYKPLDPEFLFKRRLVPDEHDWYGNSLRKAWSTHKHSSSTMDHAFQEFQACHSHGNQSETWSSIHSRSWAHPIRNHRWNISNQNELIHVRD